MNFEAEIISARLVQLLEYWNSKRTDEGIPTRDDIDPLEMAGLLGCISLIEVEGQRLRYRLVGSELYDAHGGDITGCYVDEVLTPELRDVICSQFNEVVESAEPCLHRIETDDSKGNYWQYERLTLPLAGHDAAVAMLLCGYADLDGGGFLRLHGNRGASDSGSGN